MSRKVEVSLREISGLKQDFDGLCGRSAGEKLPRKALCDVKTEAALCRNLAKTTAVDAVLKMVDKYGHVILSFKATQWAPEGREIGYFSGGYLRGLKLKITTPATLEEWDRQIEELGLEDPCKDPAGNFYHATLVCPETI